MILQNFKKMFFFGMKQSMGYFTNTTGAVSGCNNGNFDDLLSKYANTYGVRIVLGSGKTAPSNNDYCMENIITTLTLDSGSVSDNLTTNNVSVNDNLKYLATFSNNTNEDIVVSEIGLIYNYSVDYLLCREVIEPVTIKAGESRTFAITIK